MNISQSLGELHFLFPRSICNAEGSPRLKALFVYGATSLLLLQPRMNSLHCLSPCANCDSRSHNRAKSYQDKIIHGLIQSHQSGRRSKLVSGGYDKKIIIWDIEHGSSLKRLDGDMSQVHCVAVNQTGNLIASGSSDSMIRLWERV